MTTWAPGPAGVYLQMAAPVADTLAGLTAQAMGLALSEKATVPVGVPLAPASVAVSVTAALAAAGLALAERVNVVRALAPSTATASAVELADGASVELPRYWAVTVAVPPVFPVKPGVKVQVAVPAPSSGAAGHTTAATLFTVAVKATLPVGVGPEAGVTSVDTVIGWP